MKDTRKWPHNSPWRYFGMTITDTLMIGEINAEDLSALVRHMFRVTNLTVHAKFRAQRNLLEAAIARGDDEDLNAFGNVLNAAIDEQDRRRAAGDEQLEIPCIGG